MSTAERDESGRTLNQALADAGWRTEPGVIGFGKRVFDETGAAVVGVSEYGDEPTRLSAEDAWLALDGRGLLNDVERAEVRSWPVSR